VLALCASLRPKYGTPYLFTSANPKHTLPSDVILRRTTFFQPIQPPSGPCNAPWFSSETLALYKSLTYLLTYLQIWHNLRPNRLKKAKILRINFFWSTHADTMPSRTEQCFTSPPTQYRLYGRRFYRSEDPTKSIKVLKVHKHTIIIGQ